LSETVSLSLLIVDTWFQKALEKEAKDSTYGKNLAKASKSKDRQQLVELLIDALKSDQRTIDHTSISSLFFIPSLTAKPDRFY